MADPHIDDAHDEAAKSRSKSQAGSQSPASSAKPETRSFAQSSHSLQAAASDAADQTRGTMKAGQDMASAGEDAARKAGGQAVELWRASLDPLANMHGEFTRWFEQAWRQALGGRLSGGPQIGQSVLAAISGAPTADLFETETSAELAIELPGLSPKDVQLALKGELLTVSGERSESGVRQEGSYRAVSSGPSPCRRAWTPAASRRASTTAC
jgi:HSP20 family molecular chaperone IbpA